MKSTFVYLMYLVVSLSLIAQPKNSSLRIVNSYGKLPLTFEANQGQSDPKVKFLAHGAGYGLFFTSDEVVFAFGEDFSRGTTLRILKRGRGSENTLPDSKSTVFRMKLLGANAHTEVIGEDELPARSNYFIGHDPKKWHTDVLQFSKVRYANVYPHTDLVYYGHQRQLEYDFVLKPGAHPELIRLRIEGATRLRLQDGDVVLTSVAGDVHLRSPRIYQEKNGIRHRVGGHYVINSEGEIGFSVAPYNHRRALVIDPVLA
jgi:hypothetical protein